MEVDVEQLLAPVTEDNPVGDDMDGTIERFTIEESFSLDQADDTGEAEIDWRETIRQIVEQLGQTKDLWLATYLMRAGAKHGDLDVVVGGAKLLAGMLGGYWDTVYPQLDMVDFIGRKAPCEALTKGRDFLNPLRRVPLIEHGRLGRYTAEDLARFAEEGEAADGYGMFQAALEALGTGLADARDKIAAIDAAIREADMVLTLNAGDDTATNFEPTYEVLGAIARSIAALSGEDALPEDEAADEPGGEDGGAGPMPVAGVSRGGRIASRADVVAMLKAIEAYYERQEPSSPVPALLKRARTWVDMDFLKLLEDFSPDSLSDARKVLGVKADEFGGY